VVVGVAVQVLPLEVVDVVWIFIGMVPVFL